MSELSKGVGFAILNIIDGVNISKAIGYAVLSVERNIVISKAVGFAVLESEEEEEGGVVQPFVFIL